MAGKLRIINDGLNSCSDVTIFGSMVLSAPEAVTEFLGCVK
jgi:hypothetical protein